MSVNLFVVGPAGVGKSTMVGTFKRWMTLNGFNTVTINLDPGVDKLPYVPDIDIREWISLSDIMDEYELGPNGAQIVAADLLATKCDELEEVVDGFKADYFIYDTAGQLELFAFRSASEVIVNRLGGEKSAIAFLFEPMLTKTPTGFISMLLLSASVHTRFYKPFINILPKIDVLEDEDLENITKWSDSFDCLYESLISDSPSMKREFSIEMLKAMESTDLNKSLIPTSSQNLYGFEDLYSIIQMCFEGGEDIDNMNDPEE